MRAVGQDRRARRRLCRTARGPAGRRPRRSGAAACVSAGARVRDAAPTARRHRGRALSRRALVGSSATERCNGTAPRLRADVRPPWWTVHRRAWQRVGRQRVALRTPIAGRGATRRRSHAAFLATAGTSLQRLANRSRTGLCALWAAPGGGDADGRAQLGVSGHLPCRAPRRTWAAPAVLCRRRLGVLGQAIVPQGGTVLRRRAGNREPDV